MFRMLKLNCLSYKKKQFPAGTTVISVANQYANDQFQRKMAVYCIASNLNYFVPRLTSSNALQSTCMILWTKNKFLFQWFGNLEAIERTFLHNVCSYQQCSEQFHELMSDLQTAINKRYFTRYCDIETQLHHSLQ